MVFDAIWAVEGRVSKIPESLSKILNYRNKLKNHFKQDFFVPSYKDSDLENVFNNTEISSAEINSYLDELRNSSLLVQQHKILSREIGSRGYRPPVRSLALYVLIRYYGYDKIVETGSYFGQSTLYILLALEKNGSGVLHSFDAHPNDIGWYPDLPSDFELGYIVPNSLEDRWELHEGNINDTLESGIEQIGKIDLFFHDSDHSDEHKRFEFNLAKQYLNEEGILSSHDVGHGNVSNGTPPTEAFTEIAKELDSDIHSSRDFESGDDGPRVFAFLYFRSSR